MPERNSKSKYLDAQGPDMTAVLSSKANNFAPGASLATHAEGIGKMAAF